MSWGILIFHNNLVLSIKTNALQESTRILDLLFEEFQSPLPHRLPSHWTRPWTSRSLGQMWWPRSSRKSWRTCAVGRWAMLIKHVYEVDPLSCPRCATEMKVVAFIDPPQGEVTN